jgi:putative metallohydrolase (TIGR04338 family)
MPSVRDSQRSKVYAAERLIRDAHMGERLHSVQDVERFTRRVFASKRVLKRWPWLDGHSVEVHDGGGMRSAYAYNAYKIAIPLWARNAFVVLHELAHIIHRAGGRECWQTPHKVQQHGIAMPSHTEDPLWHQAHGYAFCRIHLDLVLLFIGREAHDALKASYKTQRVRYKAKRKMSPEARAAAAARLKKLRPKAEFFRRAA